MKYSILKRHKTIGIIGTDTEIRKTYVAVKILKYLNSLGFKTCGLKPIAAGGFINDDGVLVNDDAIMHPVI